MGKLFETITYEIRESLSMALAAIRINKLRSVLTLLGIAVGVFSIISVMTGMGVLLGSIESGLTQLGANTFQVQRMPAFRTGDPQERAKLRNRKYISYLQGLKVKENAVLAKEVGLEVWMFGRTVSTLRGQKTNPDVQIAGEDVEGFSTNNWNIGDGRLFTQDELSFGRRVAILGLQVQNKLFAKTDPIGQSIRIDGEEYQVIGTIEPKGGMLGGNQDNFVCMPLTTYFNVYGKERLLTSLLAGNLSRRKETGGAVFHTKPTFQ